MRITKKTHDHSASLRHFKVVLQCAGPNFVCWKGSHGGGGGDGEVVPK